MEKPDVYFSTPSQVIEFVKNPRTGKPFDSCRNTTKESCKPKVCPVKKESTGEDRWMTVCGQCPEVYPWIGNPAGKAQQKTTRGSRKTTTRGSRTTTTMMSTTPSTKQDKLPLESNSEVYPWVGNPTEKAHTTILFPMIPTK